MSQKVEGVKEAWLKPSNFLQESILNKQQHNIEKVFVGEGRLVEEGGCGPDARKQPRCNIQMHSTGENRDYLGPRGHKAFFVFKGLILLAEILLSTDE